MRLVSFGQSGIGIDGLVRASSDHQGVEHWSFDIVGVLCILVLAIQYILQNRQCSAVVYSRGFRDSSELAFPDWMITDVQCPQAATPMKNPDL